MEAYQARLDSFNKSSKRTKQSKASSSTHKWPHPSSHRATPTTLAEAGFYHNPSSECKDNVTCFICEKQLADWDQDDDPFAIHWDKCGTNCPWAIVRCGLMEDTDDHGNFVFPSPTRLPSSKAMEKARLDTFTANKWWPHDSVRGHGANSKKMAKAGFVYTPQQTGDDTATCFYCGISLSGWDEDDDPLEEHRKREQKSNNPCPFFTPKEPALGRSTSKPPSRSTSKPPSRAVTKKTKPPPPEDAESSEEEFIPAPKSRTSKKSSSDSRASSVPATAASRRSTRGATASNGRTPASRGLTNSEVEEETEASGSDVVAGKKVSRSKSKKALGQSTRKKIEVIEEEEEDEDEPEPEPEVQKPKRGRPKKTTTATAKKAPIEKDDEDEDMEPPPSKPKHTRTRSKAMLAESESEAPARKPAKAKATSKAKSKLVSDDEAIAPESKQASKKGKGKAKRMVEEEEGDDEEDDFKPPPSKTAKSDSGKKVPKSKRAVENEPDDNMDGMDIDPIAQELFEPEEPEPRAPSPPLSKSKAKGKGVDRGNSVVPPSSSRSKEEEKAKARKSSTTSDDAGYATAEVPMEVDDEVQPEVPQEPRPPSRSAPDPPISKSRTRTLSVKSNPPKAEDVPVKARDSGLTDSQKASTPPTVSALRADLESKRSRSRSGSSSQQPIPRASSVRPSARPSSRLASRNQADMAVVTISSDEEDLLGLGKEDSDKQEKVMREMRSSSRTKVLSSTSKTPSSSTLSNGKKVKPSSTASITPAEPPRSKSRAEATPSIAGLTPRDIDLQKLEVKPSASKVKKGKGKLKVEVSVPIPVSPVKSTPVLPSEDVDMEDSAPSIGRFASTATPPPHTPSLSPIYDAPTTPPAQVMAPLDSGPQPEPDPTIHEDEEDDGESPFTPFLSTLPMTKLTSLTEEESMMTLEQWIRREIETQYQQMKADGERSIAEFMEKAERTRKTIEALPTS